MKRTFLTNAVSLSDRDETVDLADQQAFEPLELSRSKKAPEFEGHNPQLMHRSHHSHHSHASHHSSHR